MSEMLLFPVFIYLVNSMSGVIYTRNFLKEEYEKGITVLIWSIVCFIMQIMIFEILDRRFPVSEVLKIILNLCLMLFLQFCFFEKDITKQIFVVFSFVTGKETIKYITTVFLQKDEMVKERGTENTSYTEQAVNKTVNDNVSDYYSYLQKNYDCVKNGNVAISGTYLKECAKNPKNLRKVYLFLKKDTKVVLEVHNQMQWLLVQSWRIIQKAGIQTIQEI